MMGLHFGLKLSLEEDKKMGFYFLGIDGLGFVGYKDFGEERIWGFGLREVD